MPLVSIIIVNWNGAEVLPECLESLLCLNHRDTEIVVVDNASADNSVDIVAKICGDKAKIIRLDKNIGFAAGVNKGFENAAGEFAALLNNDMVVEPSWLDQPLELFEDGAVGIVSCRQMNYYDRNKVDGLYHRITKELTLMPFGAGCEYRSWEDCFSKPGYVMSANGGSAVIRMEAVRAIGGFDADFFGYMEETDFCLRAFLRGWRCACAPNAVVYHMDGFSFKKNLGMQYYYRERNRVWYLYKNIPLWDIIKRLPCILIMELRVIRAFIVRAKKPLLYLKARIDALAGLGRYRQIRSENVALFKKKRAEFYRFEREGKIDFGTLCGMRRTL
ncbi:MAG: glycosyltransferase family 2 protein [Chitinispirillia bacterium]|nr:glycosyltransferase family 2 protein [Chitinispirillia bacterium]MCL2267891.1 glycosyltransferase family 2 protein [Chitinispirillia bacterium]